MGEIGRRRVLFLLLFVGLLVRLWIAWRPLTILDNLLFPDDTYISMEIARNIALGRGLTFDGLAQTNGFQPLYVFLLVPLFRLITNDLYLPIHIALTGLAVLNVLTAYLLYRIVRHVAGSPADLFALILWLFAPHVIREGMNGLETGLAVFLLALAIAIYIGAIKWPGFGRRRIVVLGAVAGLAVFARVDNAVLVVVIATAVLFSARQITWGNLWSMMRFAFAAILVLLPWFIISLACCDALIPESGQAVRFQALASFRDIPGSTATLHLYNLYITLRVLAGSPLGLDHTVLWGLAMALLVVGLIYSRSRQISWRGKASKLMEETWIRQLWPLWLYALLLLLAYNSYVLAYWFFSRYFYPVIWAATILWSIGLAAVANHLTEQQQWPQRRVILGTVAILLFWLTPGVQHLIFSAPVQGGYYNIAQWANETLPTGAVVGSAQSGALTYFARPDMTVVNMDGVANPDAFASLKAGEQFAYFQRIGLAYIVNWPINMDLLRDYGGESLETAVEPLGVVDGVETLNQQWHWYEVTAKEKK